MAPHSNSQIKKYVLLYLWHLNYGILLLILCSSTLPYSTLPYSTLLYSTLLYSTLLNSIYSTLIFSTLLYPTLLQSTLLYSPLLSSTLLSSPLLYCSELQHSITFCTCKPTVALRSWELLRNRLTSKKELSDLDSATIHKYFLQRHITIRLYNLVENEGEREG